MGRKAVAGRRGNQSEAAVMLVDDDDELREALTFLLEDYGYRVDSCSGALHALARLRSGAIPDLIVLDLMMPRMDGWQFRIEQRREPRFADVPVVVLSVDDSPQAAAIDACAYLPKPVDDWVLIDTLDRLMGALEQERKPTDVRQLEALGSLAGGIAHEVNNPLTLVLGNLELAQRKMGELERRLSGVDASTVADVAHVLVEAQRGAERIACAMRGVSMFASADSPPPQVSASAEPPGPSFDGYLGAARLRPDTWNAQASVSVVAPIRQRKPRVLVIDDEPMVCELMRATLSGDCEVTALTCPRSGLAAACEQAFDVVLCDLMMPELTGMDVYERLAAERPELAHRMVFVTGGAFTDRARQFLATTPQPHLLKPCRREQLVEVIEALLASKRPSGCDGAETRSGFADRRTSGLYAGRRGTRPPGG